MLPCATLPRHFALLCLILSTSALRGQEETPADDVLAGHSFHGEVFNEGPRQAAYLMPGLGNVDFPISATNELAQRFMNQGVAQLHGFWYYEAERSFRQAAQLEPQCAMCYWGMAMANVENRKRARDFIDQAVKLKDKATRREQLYIEAFERFCRDEDGKGKKIEKKARAQTYTNDLEELVEEFPQDVEARAFFALQLWQNERNDLPIVSRTAINAVLQDVFDANPNHPAHHYRIHLWDKNKSERALQSAALCGPSLPAIAHMWHMPGHTYSKLHRYQDAVWQQEASARVDHAHMMRDRVLPDQIHNFAHNNEWLIRNLLKVGRVTDALALAQNMLSLPRHPKYNSLNKGSTKLGRERLLLTLSTYRLWPELVQLVETNVIEATDDPLLQIERTRYLGLACALSGQPQQATTQLDALQTRLTAVSADIKRVEEEAKLDKDAKPAKESLATKSVDCEDRPPAPSNTPPTADSLKSKANRERRVKERADELKKLNEQHSSLEKAIATIQAAQAAAIEDWKQALELWEKSDLTDKLLKAEWTVAEGKFDEALKIVDKEIKDNPNEVPSHAVKTWLVYSQNGTEAAKEMFATTRQLACSADLDVPLLARLKPLASELEHAEHWAANYEPAADIGARPNFDTLGPFRWHPYWAPDFVVQDAKQQVVRLKQFSGKPTLVIFYLGFGCLHCVEQLHSFSPRAAEIREAGFEIMAISTESVESLNTGLSRYSKPLEIPLHADPELTAFKAYRCFDDFEQQPLHGTFLIDAGGRVLWQDISYEPFMDVDFVLQESQRLLRLSRDVH